MATTTAIKTLIVLSGLPYSGKSTIAAQLISELLPLHEVEGVGGRIRGGLVLSRDELVEALLADPVKQMIAKNLAEQITDPKSRFYGNLGGIRNAALSDSDVRANALNDARTVLYVNEMFERIQASDAETIICDGTHLQKLSRAFIQQFPDHRKIAIAVKTPSEICIERLAESPSTGLRATVTPEMIRKLSEVAEWPTVEEGFDEVIEK